MRSTSIMWLARRWLALTAVALITACSSVPEAPEVDAGSSCAPSASSSTAANATQAIVPPLPAASALPRVDLQGQLSLKLGALADQPAKGLSLGFFFAGNAQTGQIDLMTLTGSQMAQVNWQADEAWLINDKGRQRYLDLDELSEATLGEALPLRALVHWMQGQADPDLPSAPGPAPDTFVQAGWTIDTRELPQKKLQVHRPGTPAQRSVQIKVYLDR